MINRRPLGPGPDRASGTEAELPPAPRARLAAELLPEAGPVTTGPAPAPNTGRRALGTGPAPRPTPR
ncbi:hypothetical protein SUDANB58_05937 (plasmid) [Streptomyces sp. enrichment culture]